MQTLHAGALLDALLLPLGCLRAPSQKVSDDMPITR